MSAVERVADWLFVHLSWIRACVPGVVLTWWRRADQIVMGKSAVAVVLVYLQTPALVQLLTTLNPSGALELAGPPALGYAWAGFTVTAGLVFALSYRVRDPQDQRVVEVAALGLIIVTSITYLLAVEQAVGVGGLVTGASFGALATSCLGRAVLLLRQIYAARRLARALAAARDGEDRP